MPLLPRAARAALHFWEEPCISGKNGSGTVFFSGCSLNCVYCQNYEISHKDRGKTITYKELADIFRILEKSGAHNINLVTPTHFITSIIKALDIYKPNIPIVYNSGGYECADSLKLLKDYVDIFLIDLKYLSPERAKEYSDAENYPEFAVSAITECYKQQPESVIENGLMKKGVIVRHLLMPQATNEAIAVFEWVKNNLPNAFFSIMSQYLPLGRASEYPKINRRVTKREYNKVIEHICNSDFQNVYIQELSSSDEKYIPDFNISDIIAL